MAKAVFVLLVTLVSASSARATVLEIPVPGLVGTYSTEERIVSIHLPAIPSVIHSVSLHVRGTTAFASYSCDGSNGYGPPQPVPVGIFSDVFEGSYLTTQEWASLDGYRNAPGAFDYTQTFGHYPPPTSWSFLLDGEANMRLGTWGVPPIFECNLVGPPDSTTFDEVSLLIDGEFPTPVAATSWGRIKSIYR